MGERGPEPKKIDWEQFDKLVSYQCTQEEIAAWFGISVDTLERICVRDHGEKLADIWNKRKLFGRVRLRKMQFDIIEKGGPGAVTMAIFLGKRILGQTDEKPPEPPPPLNAAMVKPLEPVSFEEFCANAGYHRPFPKQVEMAEFALMETSPRVLLGARGYGKTDYVTIAAVAYAVYVDWFTHKHRGTSLRETNLIISKSKARNTAIIEEIAVALTKNGVVLDKQNATSIRVQGLTGKEHSVEVLTIKSSFRGRHPFRLLMDDPVTEEDTSEAMRNLVKTKYNEAYKLCKNLVIIGQPAHAFDLYADLRPILKVMEVPHGTIPQLDADLEAMKLAGVDPHSIEMSYHLRVPEEGQAIFAGVKYIGEFGGGPSVAFIDPSEGKDYTAISIGKKTFDAFCFVGNAWKKPWYHCLDDIVEMLIKYGVKKLAFETNKHGNQPVLQLRKLLKPHGIGVVGVYSDSNKHAVIEAAGSYSHLIHLSQESGKKYIELIVKYEAGSKYDDPPDSLARLLEWIGLIRGKK